MCFVANIILLNWLYLRNIKDNETHSGQHNTCSNVTFYKSICVFNDFMA